MPNCQYEIDFLIFKLYIDFSLSSDILKTEYRPSQYWN